MMINITEDEEKWLYDEDTEHEVISEKVTCADTSGEISQEISLEAKQPTSNEDPTPGFESDLADFEEDSDDDGITVSIGNTDVQPTFTHDTPNIKINGGLLAAKNEKPQSVKFVAEDFTEPGNIDGTPVGEFNINNVVEKPWRLPGADISDYFNYNFSESTWTAYCERQRRMRLNESGSGHLQSNTSHCAIPVINGYPNVPRSVIEKNYIPALNPESRGSLVFPYISKPPPMLNLGQFRPEHPNKPAQEKPSHPSPKPPISSSSSSSRSNSNTRSTKYVREEKNDSKERDLKKRRERSRERHNRKYDRREKSRSRSRRPRSRSRSPIRDRHYGNSRSRKGYH